MRALIVSSLVVGAYLCPVHTAQAAENEERTYQSADEALSVAGALLRSGNHAAARKPLEAALAMSESTDAKIRIYQALKAPYRLLEDPEPMFTASDYILRHSQRAAERSLTRTDVLGFAYQRGKLDLLAAKYEEALKENPDDVTALFVLSELYGRLKRDPKRSAQLTERLIAAQKASGQLDVGTQAQLAQQLVAGKKFAEGAAMYEQIAPQDEKLAAWHWKEAATAWLSAGKKDDALRAARESEKGSPEARSELLTHFWHKGLADVFLQTGDAKAAIPHYEQAIAHTNIDGYLKTCREQLEIAKQKAGQ